VHQVPPCQPGIVAPDAANTDPNSDNIVGDVTAIAWARIRASLTDQDIADAHLIADNSARSARQI
jgi:hypothetical protein